MHSIQTKQFNTIELPIALKLSPLNKIARDLALQDIPATLKHYNKLDPKTQKKLNDRCVFLSRDTPIGGLTGISFIELLNSVATCTSLSVKPETQVAVLQQALKTIQSPDFFPLKSVQTEESYSSTAEPPFSMLPNEMVFRILQEGEAPPTICSFFQECQSEISSWEKRKSINHLYRAFEKDLEQLNDVCGRSLTPLLATLPQVDKIESLDKLTSIIKDIVSQLPKYLPLNDEKSLRRLHKRVATLTFSSQELQSLHSWIANLRDLMSITPGQAINLPLLVSHLVTSNWFLHTYEACTRSPHIKHLGQGDIYAGMTALVHSWIAEGRGDLVFAFTLGLPEHIQFKILSPCIPFFRQQNFPGIIYETLCKNPQTAEREQGFLDLITYLTSTGLSLHSLSPQILGKILAFPIKQKALEALFFGLLREGKGEVALWFAPQIISNNSDVWAHLIRFFLQARKLNQAFALASHLDVRSSAHSELLQELVQTLYSCQEYEKSTHLCLQELFQYSDLLDVTKACGLKSVSASAIRLIQQGAVKKALYLTTKIIERGNKTDALPHLFEIAEALAKTGNWEESIQVTLELVNAEEWPRVSQMIMLFEDYDQIERALFLTNKITNDFSKANMLSHLAICLTKKNKRKEARALADECATLDRERARNAYIFIDYWHPREKTESEENS